MIRGRVLIVSGSDSSGGAGLQADIKTVTCLGGYAATAVTALTAQNTNGVCSTHNVPPDFVAQQIKVVMKDIGADVIKVGMLSSAPIVRAVAKSLTDYAQNVPRIIDPVMSAKGGYKLITRRAVGVLMDTLIRGAAVITPNLPEAEILTGLSIRTVEDMERAVEPLRSLGADSVVLKGGHLPGEDIVDFLITENGFERFEGKRIATSSTHGTGCTFASAIASGLAQGLNLHDAVKRARNYVQKAIALAPGLGMGCGPLNHSHGI